MDKGPHVPANQQTQCEQAPRTDGQELSKRINSFLIQGHPSLLISLSQHVQVVRAHGQKLIQCCSAGWSEAHI